jgi:hypothetical protein
VLVRAHRAAHRPAGTYDDRVALGSATGRPLACPIMVAASSSAISSRAAAVVVMGMARDDGRARRAATRTHATCGPRRAGGRTDGRTDGLTVVVVGRRPGRRCRRELNVPFGRKCACPVRRPTCLINCLLVATSCSLHSPFVVAGTMDVRWTGSSTNALRATELATIY